MTERELICGIYLKLSGPISLLNNISIHHEFEGGDRKICNEDHRLASRGLPIFLSHTHTHDGYFFLLTTKYLTIYYKDMKKLPENPEFAEMGHGDVILTLHILSAYLYFFYIKLGFVHMHFIIILLVLKHWCFNDTNCKLFFKNQNVHHLHFVNSYTFTCLVYLVFYK